MAGWKPGAGLQGEGTQTGFVEGSSTTAYGGFPN